MFLELTTGDYTALAGAAVIVMGGFFGGLVLVINAIKGTRSDIAAAAQRREEIATAVLNPAMTVQTAPPVSPPKGPEA